MTQPSSKRLVTEASLASATTALSATIAAAQPFVNVRDFNAKGDNSTDDTAAIQAAIASLPGGGGTVWFPPGRYILAGTLTIPTNKMVKLVGAGMGNPNGAYGTKLKRSGTGLMVSAVATGSNDVTFEIHDMEISGNGTAGALAQVTNGAQVYMRRVRFSQASGTMLTLTRAWNCAFEQVFFYDNLADATNPTVIVNGSVDGESNTVHWALCEWERCYATNIKIDSTSTFGAQFVNFNNCKWEAHAPVIIDIANGQGCEWTDCFIYMGLATDTGLLVRQSKSGASPVRANAFTNCTFSHVGTAAPYFVEVLGGNLLMANCGIDGVPTTKYFHVGSAAPFDALKTVNLAVPTPSLLFQDDRAAGSGLTTPHFGSIEGNSSMRGEVHVYSPTSGAGSGRVWIGAARTAVVYADATSFLMRAPTTTAPFQFQKSDTTLLGQFNADGSIQTTRNNGVLGARIWSGTAAPALSGALGDVYFRTDGGAGTWLYRCTTAGSATTGAWTAVI